jgi:hypothetical protein
MGAAAVEIVTVTGTQNTLLIPHGDLDAPAQNDAAFLRFVAEHGFAGVGTRSIALAQNLKLLPSPVAAELAEADPFLAELRQLAGAEEYLVLRRQLQGEELGQSHGDSVQQLFQ